MSTTKTPSLISAAGTRRDTGLLTGLRAHLVAVYRAVVNRRDIVRLQDLSSEQLNDIGLTSGDLRQALSESAFFRDPSARIVDLARSDRRARR